MKNEQALRAQLEELTQAVREPSAHWQTRARERQDQLTKPPGSLGELESIGVRLAGIQETDRPSIRAPHVVIAAADHGITAEGVSAYPQEVTAQMLHNIVRGGAAITTIARSVGAPLTVVDVGVKGVTPEGILSCKRIESTKNFLEEQAMSDELMLHTVLDGAAFARSLAVSADLLALGELGIGNTAAASALTASLLTLPPSVTTGRGTMVSDTQLEHKIRVIEQALTRVARAQGDPLATLAAVGGLEIAFLAGCLIGGALTRLPMIIDGFPCSAAALVAVAVCPRVQHYLFASHVSLEQGHRHVLNHFKLRPLLDLRMRLGEGTGAALAIPIVVTAAKLQSEMATFEEAAVSTASESTQPPPGSTTNEE